MLYVVGFYWSFVMEYLLAGCQVMMGVLGSDDDALEAALGLGELAGLTVSNEADSLTYDVSISDLINMLLGTERSA